MRMTQIRRVAVALSVSLLFWGGLAAQEAVEVFQGEAVEQFLLKGKVTGLRNIGKGITLPERATLTLDGATHDAAFKTIDEAKMGFTQMARGGGELHFQDSWKTEIPAYEVDKIVGLGMVPATVERSIGNRLGSLQFWVRSMMPEAERLKKKISAPDTEAWNRQMYKARLFDALIYNVDRHLNNILVTEDFQLRLIDHSRSFRPFKDLKEPKALPRFSRSLLESIQKLERADLNKRVGRYLTPYQIDGLLARRDAILALAQKLAAEKGEGAVLYP